MKILVTGAKGQLGSEIRDIVSDLPGFEFDFHDIDTLDLADAKLLNNYFNTHKPDFVINCAAYTAVDKAETDKDNALKVNAHVVKDLVEKCAEHGSHFMHISTDYIFNGMNHRPYIESDPADPKCVYGLTKLEGEKTALKYKKSIIIRTSWLYSAYGNNFVKTMMRLGGEKPELKVIFDQVGSPTYAHDLAKIIFTIIKKTSENSSNFVPGIYHFSNEGVCSWYDFAQEIMSINNLKCKIIPIETAEYPTPAKRPNYSVLNKNKLKKTFNIEIPYWKDSLKVCIHKINRK